jgi:hypothetical protein
MCARQVEVVDEMTTRRSIRDILIYGVIYFCVSIRIQLYELCYQQQNSLGKVTEHSEDNGDPFEG